jgi:hypothetical protein
MVYIEVKSGKVDINKTYKKFLKKNKKMTHINNFSS